MSASTLDPWITEDVKAVLDNLVPPPPYNGDLSKKFLSDLGFKLGSFKELLNKIQDKINADVRLQFNRPFDWTKITPNSKTKKKFDQEYLSRTINDLITKFDRVLSSPPYAN